MNNYNNGNYNDYNYNNNSNNNTHDDDYYSYRSYHYNDSNSHYDCFLTSSKYKNFARKHPIIGGLIDIIAALLIITSPVTLYALFLKGFPMLLEFLTNIWWAIDKL